jgi:hypothetical protein
MAALRFPSPPTARWPLLPSQASRSASASSYTLGIHPPRRLAARRAKGQDAEAEQAPVRTLLIDNYDSYTYNLFQELSVVNGGEYRLCACCCVALRCVNVGELIPLIVSQCRRWSCATTSGLGGTCSAGYTRSGSLTTSSSRLALDLRRVLAT